ncbi:hypothetical protein HanIR_Chr07g0309031 [Helianthus annuus]|nr:hypothetical protein HanIR_Chr07g0309031 [Helianthus annuus]
MELGVTRMLNHGWRCILLVGTFNLCHNSLNNLYTRTSFSLTFIGDGKGNKRNTVRSSKSPENSWRRRQDECINPVRRNSINHVRRNSINPSDLRKSRPMKQRLIHTSDQHRPTHPSLPPPPFVVDNLHQTLRREVPVSVFLPSFRPKYLLSSRRRKRGKWRWKVDEDDSRMRSIRMIHVCLFAWSIRMIQHTARRIVVKDYVFFIFPIMLRLFFSRNWNL